MVAAAGLTLSVVPAAAACERAPLTPAWKANALALAPYCFDPTDPSNVQRVLEDIDALPPTWPLPPSLRYASDTFVWRGEAEISFANRAQPASLTYSFAPDGAAWGLNDVPVPGGTSTGPNVLSDAFEMVFGEGNVDLGREYVRQSLAAWTRDGGLLLREVADDGVPMNQLTERAPTRGDVRIGGVSLGIVGTLAYNAFPSADGVSGIGGADMLINTSYFAQRIFDNPGEDYIGFRNTVTHELGHGLGFIHVVPCNATKLMEPFIFEFFEGVQVDDRRAIARNYGDRFSGNNSPGNATDFGNLTSPETRSVIEPWLSTNGSSGFGNSDEDWFRFTIDRNASVEITATPAGGSYNAQQQFSGCQSDDPPTIDAFAAGNLAMELRDGSGTNVIMTASSQPRGAAETITLPTLTPGTYVIKVRDTGPNPAADQVVQLYDLAVRVDGAPAAPIAWAGIPKRVEAGEKCFYIGDINSAPTEDVAAILPDGYDWDLDGDGVFEVQGDPRPVIEYVSDGVYDVTLRVTDTNGATGEHTITTTVHGATTTLASVGPDEGQVGATVPVTIEGTNLLTVSSASQVSVSGGGVQVIGTPEVNALGSRIDGLSFVISDGATLGSRDVTVSTGGGIGVGFGAFEVLASTDPADLDGDGVVGAQDLAILIAGWGQCEPGQPCPADLTGEGVVDASDLALLINAWG